MAFIDFWCGMCGEPLSRETEDTHVCREDCGHHPEWFNDAGGCHHPNCKGKS